MLGRSFHEFRGSRVVLVVLRSLIDACLILLMQDSRWGTGKGCESESERVRVDNLNVP